MYSNLQMQLKMRMENLNLSAAALERKANLKIHAVRNILLGKSKRPSGETLQSIADALGCSVKDLFSSTEINNHSFNEEKKKTDIFDASLFLASTETALKLFTEKDFKPTLEQTISMIKEIYSYSYKNNLMKVDENFAKWLLDKEITS